MRTGTQTRQPSSHLGSRCLSRERNAGLLSQGFVPFPRGFHWPTPPLHAPALPPSLPPPLPALGSSSFLEELVVLTMVAKALHKVHPGQSKEATRLPPSLPLPPLREIPPPGFFSKGKARPLQIPRRTRSHKSHNRRHLPGKRREQGSHPLRRRGAFPTGAHLALAPGLLAPCQGDSGAEGKQKQPSSSGEPPSPRGGKAAIGSNLLP